MPPAPPALRRVVLWVPDWPVAAAVLDGAVTAVDPVAVHDQRGIVVASAPARRAGVEVGMRRRVAQSLCPDLRFPGRDARSFEPVVRAAETVVAHTEVLRPGLLVMGARGPARYLGSEDAVAEALVGVAADEAGVESQAGIADGLLAAVLAARAGILVPTGSAGEFLAAQDVGVLTHATATRRAGAEVAELVDLLRRLGLHTLGALAALPTGDVAARLGSLGLRAHHLARGGDERPPAGARPEGDVRVHVDLDPPADRADRAAFAARALAERLAEQLLHGGVTCARLEVGAATEDGAELSRTWLLDAGATAAEMTDRVRWQLDGWLAGRSGQPPAAPLTRLELIAHEVTPAGMTQDGLWGRARRGQLQAERAALRVQGLLGDQGVLVPVTQGGRDPRSRARLVVWGDEPVALRPARAPWPGSLPEPWPATVPAQPIEVEVLDAAERAVGVDGRAALSAPPAQLRAPTEAGLPRRMAVTSWAGPWPVTERWWEAGGQRRAYLQVATGATPALLLGVRQGRWLVEGVYD